MKYVSFSCFGCVVRLLDGLGDQAKGYQDKRAMKLLEKSFSREDW